jgi:RNA-directed DNA polymerase
MTDDDLRDGLRQMSRQRELDLGEAGETCSAQVSGEPKRAIGEGARRQWKELMELVATHGNLVQAMQRVCRNKGSPGIDGMTVDELPGYWKRSAETLRAQLLAGTYEPQPVRRVTIPKSGGGERELGIPTVVDRLVQQAILQVLGPRFDRHFSAHSYGFRPRRSAVQAVTQAQRYVRAGFDWVVDVDLERFFDRVNHDVLMERLARRIEDRRMLRIIRRFLEAGIMANGIVIDREDGTPQGGPLSPLLANVMLDDVDKALQARGHHFVRYADDCNVYVRSKRAGERVMAALREELTRLRLRVNEAKSAVDRPWNRSFLGFSFSEHQARRRVSTRSLEKLKNRIRELTNRNRGVSFDRVFWDVKTYLTGWLNYFRPCEVREPRIVIDRWIRNRLRLYQLRLWRRPKRIYFQLLALGADMRQAAITARLASHWWRATHTAGIQVGIPEHYFQQRKLPSITW